MAYPPLSLLKRLSLGTKLTPAQEDQNKTDIETGVNAQAAQLAVALNPSGTLKNNSVATAAIQDRAVTLAKLAFLSSFYAQDTGAANAMVIAWTPVLGAYVAGLVFYVRAVATNTGATTLKVDALAPVNVQRFSGTTLGALTAGDIVAGNIYVLVYDGAEFLLLNPTPGSLATGPVILTTPGLIYAFAGAVAWTTIAPAGLLAGLGVSTAAKAVILQCRSRWNSATDGECVTEVRKDSLASPLLLNRCGGTDAVVCMNQGVYPIVPATLLFDYRMTTTVPGVGETEIYCVGYYL